MTIPPARAAAQDMDQDLPRPSRTAHPAVAKANQFGEYVAYFGHDGTIPQARAVLIASAGNVAGSFDPVSGIGASMPDPTTVRVTTAGGANSSRGGKQHQRHRHRAAPPRGRADPQRSERGRDLSAVSLSHTPTHSGDLMMTPASVRGRVCARQESVLSPSTIEEDQLRAFRTKIFRARIAAAMLVFGVPVVPAAADDSVASVAALRAVPVASLSNGAGIRTNGYYAASDGGQGSYTWSVNASNSDDGCLYIKPTAVSGSGRWVLQLGSGGDLSAAACGVKGDFDWSNQSAALDNTTVLQNAINAAGSIAAHGQGLRLTLPPGNILTGPVTVSKQIHLQGLGEYVTALVSKSSSTAAVLTVQLAQPYDFVSAGLPAAGVIFKDFRITSQAGRDNSNANASGIEVKTGTPNSWVRIDDVWFYNLGGAGIRGYSYPGFVECTRCNFVGNTYGTDTNSVFDWRFVDCDWGVNWEANIRSSGDGMMNYYNPNIYASQNYGVIAYKTDMKLYSGDISLNGKAALSITAADPGQIVRVNLVGTTNFGQNSNRFPGEYSDIEVTGNGTALNLSQARFTQKPRSQDANAKIKHNIWIEPNSNPLMTELDSFFQGGSIDAPDVTNARAKIRALSLSPYGNYTPSAFTSGGSGLTTGTVTGSYGLTGKRVDVEIVIPITTGGSGYFVAAKLPPGLLPKRDGTARAHNKSTGRILSAELVAGQDNVYIRNADGSYPGADNQVLTVNASYEIQ